MKYKKRGVVASQGSGRLQSTAKRSSSVGSRGALAARSVVAPQGSRSQSSAKRSSSVGSRGALAARPTIKSDSIELEQAKGAFIESAQDQLSSFEEQRETFEMAQDVNLMSDEGINAWGDNKYYLYELKKKSNELPNPSDDKLEEAGMDLARARRLDSNGVSQWLAPMSPIHHPGRPLVSDQQPLLLWDALANNRHPIRPQVHPLSNQEPFLPQGQSGMPSGNVELSRGSDSDTGLGAVGSMSPNNRHPIRAQVHPLSDQQLFLPQGQLGMPSDNTAAQHQPPTDGSPSVADSEDQNTDEMTSQICEDFQKALEEQAASEGEATPIEAAGSSSTSSGGSLSAAGVSGDADHNARGL